MTAFAPLHQAYCRACQKFVRIPDRLPQSVLSEVVILRRTGQLLEAIKKLRSAASIEIAEAKILVLHLSRESGVCNRCCQPIRGDTQAIECPNCGSVTFNF